MPAREVPSIRILPMSDKIPGFRGRSIEQVQKQCFLRDLPARGGRFRYQKTGLNAPPRTLVLFQFKARIVAAAVFRRDEKYEQPTRGYGGALHFDPASVRTFQPLDVAAMRKVWPAFRAFGHVKQHLNPTLSAKFERQLKNVGRHVDAPTATRRATSPRAKAKATPARHAASLS